MSLLDQLLYGIRYVSYLGATLPEENTLAFSGSGVVVQDSSSTKQTLVIIAGGASAAPVTPTSISASGNISPTTATSYSIEAASLTLTYLGTPPDGLILGFIDTIQSWSNATPFTFVSQGGGTIRNPNNLAGTDTGSVTLTQIGSSMAWQWKNSKSKWLPCAF
jgi:hypothetical protein